MDFAAHLKDASLVGSDVSSFQVLEDFFEGFPLQNEKQWPLAHLSDGVEPRYSKALVHTDRFGMDEVLSLEVNYNFKNFSYFLVEDWQYDDAKLELSLESLVKKGKSFLKNTFVYDLIEKHYRFLKNLADCSKLEKKNILLHVHAHSGKVGDVLANGGYVWATQGFDFESVSELNIMRLKFHEFAKEHGVDFDFKDLKYFKHPCHFAAFRADQKVDGKNLGRAFLLQSSWRGKISADMDEKSEVYRYKKAYHQLGEKAAEHELSRSFRKMMRRYNKSDRPLVERKNIFSFIKTLSR